MHSIILVKACKGQTIGFEDLVGIEVLAFGLVLVEDETQIVVAESICIHPPPENTRNIPELCSSFFFCSPVTLLVHQRFY